MDGNPIIQSAGLIIEDSCVKVHHIDVKQYGMKKICSVFLFETPDAVAIVDTGTSDDFAAIRGYMKKHGIDAAKVVYVVPSHFHFDHFGGGWVAWQSLVDSNPEVKVLTTRATKDRLQDASLHLQRAARTFGTGFVGKMQPLPEEAYHLVEPGAHIPLPGADPGIGITLVPTPGHTADHVSPTLASNGRTIFTFLGEAGGTLFHSSKLVTFGTSMPPEYDSNAYIDSLERLIALQPRAVGFCHFGAVAGKEAVSTVLRENMAFTKFFKDFVKNQYERSGSVREVVERFIAEEAPKRTDWPHNDLLVKIVVALVYGQLVDLGLKDPK